MIVVNQNTTEQSSGCQVSKPETKRGENARFDGMNVATIVTICTHELHHELDELLPSARVAFPDALIVVGTDRLDESLKAHIEGTLNVDNVRYVELDLEKAARLSAKTATVSDYWRADAIWCKLDLLRSEVFNLPYGSNDGVLLVDSDITFRGGFERPFFGDVVLSPFYWGNLELKAAKDPQNKDAGKIDLHERDGFFNAGMLLTRSLEFCDWWMETFESGRYGFYEQRCLNAVPELFATDYFSPLHNFGKWRFASPYPEVLSFHQHLRETARASHTINLKLAAQQSASSARRILRERRAS